MSESDQRERLRELEERATLAEQELAAERAAGESRLQFLQNRVFQAQSRINTLEAEVEELRAHGPAPAEPGAVGSEADRLQAAEHKLLFFEKELREVHYRVADALARGEGLPEPNRPQPGESLDQHYQQLAWSMSLGKALEHERQAAETLRESHARLERELVEARLRCEQPAPAAAPSADPEMERLAFSDSLTGLANANLMHRYLDQLHGGLSTGQGGAALILVDLDRLRNVNLTMGPEAGDQLIRDVGARFHGLMEANHVLGRWSEDNFVVVVHLASATQEAAVQAAAGLAGRLLAALEAPFRLTDQVLAITACAGVAPAGADSPRVWMERAQLALRRAKEFGRNRVELYHPKMEERGRRRISLLPALQKALREEEFTMQYQPVVALDSGKIWGVEALLRWNHPVQGLLEPAAFLDIAIESGLIVPIGAWAIKEVVNVAAGLRDLHFSVNLSAREILQVDFVRRLTKALELAHQVRPEQLILEVSEQEFAKDPDGLEKIMGELVRWKMQIAVDNFGLDSFSLRRLKRLQARYIKLGPGLIGECHDSHGRSLCLAAAQLSTHLGCQVWAQGLESSEQLQYLASVGCQLGQGNYLCPPLPIGMLREQLRLSTPPWGKKAARV